MYTLGYRFRPWKDAKAIADGPSILSYIREVASDHGIDRQIRYGHRVVGASWSTPDRKMDGRNRARRGARVPFLRLPVDVQAATTATRRATCPSFPASTASRAGSCIRSTGRRTLDYAGKKVVVIGSGATAVTVVPSMAETASHVTMLQRSPTYVVARPAQDPIANKLRRRLPLKLAYMLTRWKNVLLGMYFYQLCKRQAGEGEEP
jgi:cation diffusion facilitator CzcD-associated flavoprotein CzcO